MLVIKVTLIIKALCPKSKILSIRLLKEPIHIAIKTP